MMEHMIKIALLAHSENALSSLRANLEAAQCEVAIYTDSALLLEDLVEFPPDMVMHMDEATSRALDFIGPLRRVSAVPLAVLTPQNDEMDEILLLKLGADMVVALPYSQRLLLERMRALLRRGRYEAEKYQALLGEKAEDFIVRGDLLLDKARYLCRWKGLDVPITSVEFGLLESLVK